MKISKIKSLLMLLVSMMMFANSRAADLYPYLDDLEVARAEARKQQLPLMIVFRCEP